MNILNIMIKLFNIVNNLEDTLHLKSKIYFED